MGCDGGNCGGTPSVVFGYVGTAILLKFLFGIDDVVWLAPFMAREVMGVHSRDDDRGHLHRDRSRHVPLVLA